MSYSMTHITCPALTIEYFRCALATTDFGQYSSCSNDFETLAVK